MIKEYKKSSISKTYPHQIEKIKLSDLDWTIDLEFENLILTECKLPTIDNTNDIGFGMYAYEKNSEAYLYKDLNNINSFPIIFDFAKRGLTITRKPYFRVYLYDLKSKRILASTTDLLLINKKSSRSLLPVYPSNIGNRISHLIIEDDGPVLFISKNFKTSKGDPIVYTKLLNILREDPSFVCGFFPNILDTIFKEAYINRKQDWAKPWIAFANDMVKGIFPENEKFEVDDQEFDRKLMELSDKWIIKNKYDQILFNKLDGIEE